MVFSHRIFHSLDPNMAPIFARAMPLAIAVFVAAFFANDRLEAQAPPRPADQAAINSAIQKGVSYLRGSQNPATGGWGSGTKAGSDGGWAIGYASLAGITLIECGVPTSDPGLKAAAKGVRDFSSELDSTYEVALAILFLDRMGEKSDRAKIQLLAGRLIAGQSPSGGWGYKVPKKRFEDVDTLLKALRRLSPPQAYAGPSQRERPASMSMCIKASDDLASRPPPAPFDLEKAKAAVVSTLPVAMKNLPVFVDMKKMFGPDPKDKGGDVINPTTDNSNTHFATLALWASRKYDVPTDRSFALLANRFRSSQGPDGTWDYGYVPGGKSGPPAMTCVALLGLAIGHVLNADPSVKAEKDPQVISAFTALSKQIGAPAGRIEGRARPDAIGGLYFLWNMERIAVLYDVGQLDNKDWYLWGAEILLCHQLTDGSWEKGGYHGEHPVLNTCFALLFLKRANLTPDLSRRLTVDTATLTQKVNDIVKPVVVAPPEPTKPPEIAVIETAPAPRPVQTKAKVEPVAVTTVTDTAAPPPQPASKLPWIMAGLGAVVLSGALLFCALRKRKDVNDDEEDEADEEDEVRPRKKTKKKVKAVEKANLSQKSSGKAKPAVKRALKDD